MDKGKRLWADLLKGRQILKGFFLQRWIHCSGIGTKVSKELFSNAVNTGKQSQASSHSYDA